MTDSPLLSSLEQFEQTKVLVVGDIMLDRFVYGDVERISPESPVPVLNIVREDTMLGGAGNALANLAGLGAQAEIFAVIGDDEEGRILKQQIEKLGYEAHGLCIDAERPTTVKTRFLAGHQQLLRSDFENKAPLKETIQNDLLQKLKPAIKDAGAIILSDYGKGLLHPELIAQIMELANDSNIPVIVDPKGQDFSIYKGAFAVTPNKKELADATKGASLGTDEEVVAAAQSLMNECGIQAVVATRSAEGMSVIQKDQPSTHLRTIDIEVFDVSGAGDSVIATIAAALASGSDLPQAASLANLAGSVVVTKVGTAPIRIEELREAVLEHGEDQIREGAKKKSINRHRQGDVLGWEAAAEQIRRWKAKGLKVGFTNGCFDILHYGHVSYLNNTRDHCDRLIVGLNQDSSVRVLKGAERPVHDESSRAAVLAALGSVDMVVLFGAEKEGDDNTAIALLETLQPDIYFKGGDYTEDQIPEAPSVKAYGGEVSVMPVYDGHSTTGSIAKMKSGKAA